MQNPPEIDWSKVTKDIRKCPICGVDSNKFGNKFKKFNSLIAHIQTAHPDAYKTNKDTLIAINKGNGDLEGKKDDKGDRKEVANEKQEQDDRIDVMNELREIIKKAGGPRISKVDTVVDIFSHYDPDDLEALKSIMKDTNWDVSIQKLIMRNYALYRQIPQNKVPEVTPPDQPPKGGKGGGEEHPEETPKPKSSKEMLDTLKSKMMERLKSKMDELELAETAERMGIDPKDYGLPVPQHKDKDAGEKHSFEFPPDSGNFVTLTDKEFTDQMIQWNKTHSKKEEVKKKHEFPPGSGEFVDMTDADYADRVLEWDRIHGKERQIKEQENMVDWEDPKTHVHIKIPASEYMRLSVEMTRDEEITELKKQNKVLEDKLTEIITNKQFDEIKGYAGSLQKQLEENKKKIQEIESRDPLVEARKRTSEALKVAEQYGYKPGARTVEDEAYLKTLSTNSDMQLQIVKAGVKRLEGSTKRFDRVADILEPIVKELSQDVAKEISERRRNKAYGQVEPTPVPGNETPFTDEQLDEMTKKLGGRVPDVRAQPPMPPQNKVIVKSTKGGEQ